VADNKTEQGRRLNRRVEVQVWYDEVSEKKVEKEVIVLAPALRTWFPPFITTGEC
jgi:hypothetical protein